MAHGIEYSPRNEAIVKAGRLFAQKLLLEQERRQAFREADSALRRCMDRGEQAPDVPDTLVERLRENARLSAEALGVACAAVDGCVMDFAESAREYLAAAAPPLTVMADATGAAIIEENVERRQA